MPVVKKNYKGPVRKTRGSKQQGGASATYSLGPSSVAPGAPYAQTVIPGEACQAATKFDAISGYIPPGRGGLPGYAGGGRRSRRTRRVKHLGHKFAEFSKRVLKSLHFFKGRRGRSRSKRSRRSQRGGAGYTVDVGATTGGPNPLPPVVKTACEGGPVTTQQYIAPGVQRGGVGGVDSAFLQMQNAGYSNDAPKWVSTVGTPGGGAMVQTPYAAGSMNPACVQMGAGRRRGRKQKRTTRKRCY
jgi:hypothetical protein